MSKSRRSEPMLSLGEIKTLSIDEVKPYWRNPRRVPEEAVNYLVQSIETYGYQQPIVVDEDHVIIIGHTRYAAFRRMDAQQIPVSVASNLSQKKVKELRVIDNRAGEQSSWDFDTLVAELTDLDRDVAQAFFPDVPLADMEQWEIASDPSEHLGEDGELPWEHVPGVDFVCPSCFFSFEAQVTHEQIMNGRIESA